MLKLIGFAIVFLVVAFALVGLGMRIERRHNKNVWDKYYEGAGLAGNTAQQLRRQGAPR